MRRALPRRTYAEVAQLNAFASMAYAANEQMRRPLAPRDFLPAAQLSGFGDDSSWLDTLTGVVQAVAPAAAQITAAATGSGYRMPGTQYVGPGSGVPQYTTNYPPAGLPAARPDNTLLYAGIGAAALIGVVFLMKK